MKLTTEDMIKFKLQDAQENVRDYQKYSGKTDNKEVDEVFKQFAEESGMQARKLQELLNRCDSNR
jgi:rubrerythrin